MLSTTLLTLTAILGVSSALPVENILERQNNCPVDLPQNLVQLHENNPNLYYDDTARTTQDMYLYQDVNGATNKVADRIASLVAFTPPTSSWGCALKINFPSDYTFPAWTGGPQTVNIYTVPTPIPASPTWNNIVPNKGSLWATVTVKPGLTATINSESCPTTAGGQLAFLVEYADWVGTPGTVEWTNYVNTMNGQGVRGVYMTYNC